MKTLFAKPNLFTPAILVLFCVLFIANQSAGQLQITISSTSSTCENNGEVGVNVTSGSGPFSYKIQGENNFELLNSSEAPSYLWTSLFPGKYYVTVTNETSITEDSIEVQGNYVSLDGVADIVRMTDCPDSFDGEIMLETEGGREPFVYQLFEGTYDPDAISIAENQTGFFEDLNSQVYTILAIDSCSNQIARTVDLTFVEPIFITQISHRFTACDSLLLNAKVFEFSTPLPFQVRVISPDSLISEYADSINAVFGYEESLDVKYEFRDQCGRTYIRNSGVQSFNFRGEVGKFTCDTYSIFYSTNFTPPYDITLTNSEGEVLFLDTLPVLENITYGNWNILIIEDACGRTAQVFTNSIQFSKVNEIIVTQNPCFLQNSIVIFNLDGVANGPVTLDFIEHPENFTTENFTWNNGGTSFRINDNQVNFKPGEYEAIFSDSCGIKDTVMFQIEAADLLEIELLTSVTPQCSDLSHINFNTVFNTNFINPGIATLTKEDDFSFVETNSNVIEGSFTFLDTGTYYLSYAPCGITDSMVYDTITLDTTPFPEILSAASINCENEDSLAIYVDGDLGIAPYLYRIVDGPQAENFPSEWQELPILGKVPLGEGYKVQLLDQCGTTTSSDVSEVLNLEPVVIEDFTLCDSDTVIFTIKDALIGLNYLWTGPNNEMCDTTLFKMHKEDITGPILLESNLSGCASNQIFYEWSQECLLPVEFLNFTIQESDNGHLLKWSTTTEINNSHFDVQHSSSTVHWKTIGNIIGKNNFHGISKYKFVNKTPFPGLNYYRLKQYDFNGSFAYSDILFLNLKQATPVIYPNPTNGIFEIKYLNNIEIISIDIFSVTGDLVYQKSIQSLSPLQVDLGFLPPSIYYLRINHKSIPPYFTSLIKN